MSHLSYFVGAGANDFSMSKPVQSNKGVQSLQTTKEFIKDIIEDII